MLFASVSLLLLLLFIYLVYRRRFTQQNETKLSKQHRQNLETNLLIHDQFEYRLPTIHSSLPTIIEENSSTLSPSNSSNKFTPLSTLTNTPTSSSSSVVSG